MAKLIIITVALAMLFGECQGQTEGAACSESSSVMKADPAGDCSKFFRCEADKYMSYVCTAGMVFDNDHCTWPEMSRSSCKTPTRSGVQLIPIDQTTTCVYQCPATQSTVYPDWNDNGKLYICKSGKLYLASCSDLGTSPSYSYFDPTFKSCDQIQSSRNVHFVQFRR